jgi:enoyl-CoA hydratase/carnithine racemase
MILTAELLDAEALLTSGFVHEVLPDQDGLMARANQLAERMKQMAPLTVQASLEGLRRLRRVAPLPDDNDLIREKLCERRFCRRGSRLS